MESPSLQEKEEIIWTYKRKKYKFGKGKMLKVKCYEKENYNKSRD